VLPLWDQLPGTTLRIRNHPKKSFVGPGIDPIETGVESTSTVALDDNVIYDRNPCVTEDDNALNARAIKLAFHWGTKCIDSTQIAFFSFKMFINKSFSATALVAVAFSICVQALPQTSSDQPAEVHHIIIDNKSVLLTRRLMAFLLTRN
jgi:hypothetical protein